MIRNGYIRCIVSCRLQVTSICTNYTSSPSWIALKCEGFHYQATSTFRHRYNLGRPTNFAHFLFCIAGLERFQNTFLQAICGISRCRRGILPGKDHALLRDFSLEKTVDKRSKTGLEKKWKIVFKKKHGIHVIMAKIGHIWLIFLVKVIQN